MSIISHSLSILPLAFISLSVGVSTAHAETIDVKISAESTNLPQELRVIHSVGKGESCDAAYSAMMKNAETTAGELKVPMAFFNAKDPNSVDRLQSLTCEPAGKKVKVEARVLMGKLYEDSTTLPQEKVLGIISSTAIPKGKPFAGGTRTERTAREMEQSGDLKVSGPKFPLSLIYKGKRRPFSETDLAIRGIGFSDRRSGVWMHTTSPYVGNTFSNDDRFVASDLFKEAVQVPLLKWAEALKAHPEIDGLHISAVSERKQVGAGSSWYRFHYFVPRKAAELYVAGDDKWGKLVEVEVKRGGETIQIQKPYFR